MRDETDLGGLKLTIDFKTRCGPEQADAEAVPADPLQDSFPCNFNILIAGMPRVMGVGEILEEWIAWRTDCIKRRIFYQIQKKEDRLHLLRGLERILLDIDKAVAIIRQTELESEVVPNLMIGFGIDEIQANFVAEIKLRNINKEYILKQTRPSTKWIRRSPICGTTLNSPRKLKNVIIRSCRGFREIRLSPENRDRLQTLRRIVEEDEEEQRRIPGYRLRLQEGYLKKITQQSLRMSGEQKFKEGDSLL